MVRSGRYGTLVFEIENEVESYFSGMDLPEEATLYDYLVLSLRNKDIIATFNWDPFLAKAFQRNQNVVGYENMPTITFLHGNVEIGVCYLCESKGWRNNACDHCGRQFEPSKLLYPVSEKNYSSDKFIGSEWSNLQSLLQQAYCLTVFGYSAPVTDVEARELLLEVWTENPKRELAHMDFIDKKPRKEITENWKDFLVKEDCVVRESFFDTYLAMHPRRSCDAFAMATLQQRPWEDNQLPKDLSLEELQDWVMPLVTEEQHSYLSGEPCGEKT